MAEILVKLRSNVNPNPAKDLLCIKAGMPVCVMSDGWQWGLEERPPSFFVLKLPGISTDRVQKYLAPYEEQDGFGEDGTPMMRLVRRKLWRFRIEDMPSAARNKINNGVLTIGPGGDYTWTQVRTYLRNLRTGLDETENI